MRGLYGRSRPMLTMDEFEELHGDCCEQFAKGQDAKEGVSGRKRIDTSYENYCNEDDIVRGARSKQ